MSVNRIPHNILITGGAGFIGSAFIRYLLDSSLFSGSILNLDLLTYAGNLKNLEAIEKDSRYQFFQGDICDKSLLEKLHREHSFNTIVHFAAETHVDRSITDPAPFIETNIKGTFTLLELVKKHPETHFHHISTDEVYGSLGECGQFNENSLYRPNSPYAASKAASDHLVRAYANTYGISTTLSHSSNNYGPFQYPEKFIPLMLTNCLKKAPLPVYGRGINIRDWLYVDDHSEALWTILTKGKKGQIYDIGANQEIKNIDLLYLLIDLLTEETKEDKKTYHSLIKFINDRPGHDLRYSIDSTKLFNELGWRPRYDIVMGLKKTVQWYLQDKESPRALSD